MRLVIYLVALESLWLKQLPSFESIVNKSIINLKLKLHNDMPMNVMRRNDAAEITYVRIYIF